MKNQQTFALYLQEENTVLNDGSGLSMYEAKCSGSTVIPDVWPECVPFVSLNQI